MKIKNFITSTSAWLVMAFLYFPLFIIILYSFNDASVASFPIQNYTLKWYKIMWEDRSLMEAVKISFLIAIISTFIALIIGIPSAYALHKFDYPGKKALERIILLPITLPGIVTGVAMLSFFPLMGLKISLLAVVVGHITFLLAIVITQLLARFKRLDPFLEQAAYDLGAKPFAMFFSVILPNISTAIIGAVLLCLVLSMDEIPVTFFLIARDNTLPIEIYGMMRRGITPEVNAISTMVFLFSTIGIILSLKLNSNKELN